MKSAYYMWTVKGMDTLDIAKALNRHESVIYNHLSAQRKYKRHKG